MDTKKILVAYYSRTGITKKVANKIKESLNCDIEEIIDKKNRKGFFGYIAAGYSALKGSMTEIVEPKLDPSDYDIVIIGTPVWAGRIANAIRAYINKNAGKIKNIMVFCTQSGESKNKVYNDIKECYGREPLEALTLTGKQIKNGSYEKELAKFVEAAK